jgi:hypothetical protein
MSEISPLLTGTHHHMFDNLPDVQPGEDGAEGDVFTLDADLHPVWEPPASAQHDIISETHTDTDTGDTPGDGDVLTFDTADSKWHPVAPAATGYATVEDEGTPLTQRSTLNFVGSGVSAADSGGVTTVTISGGGGGTGRFYIPFGSGEEVFSP